MENKIMQQLIQDLSDFVKRVSKGDVDVERAEVEILPQIVHELYLLLCEA